MPRRADAERAPAALRVVGIDPGLANLGLGAIEEVRREARLLGVSWVRTSSRRPQAERLRAIRDAVAAFLDEHRPDAVAIEGQYFHHQRDVAFRVGQAFGVVVLSAADRDIPVFEYGPMQVKQALVGSGRAHKDQVGFMVRALLHLEATPESNHVADALALALTHVHSRRLQARMGEGGDLDGR